MGMSKVKEIERAVAKLKPEELAGFRAWFEEFDARVWDEQLEKDIQSGRLDRVAERSIAEYARGRAKPL